jgi:mannose-6-phosphate isomerase
MKGFRPVPEMVALFTDACPRELSDAIGFLKRNPTANGIQRFFEALMTLPDQKIRKVIEETASNAAADPEKNDEFRWIKTLYELYPDDIGILSPILLNLVCLKPGEALFLNSGEMHAYLEGAGIEIMANSDNVLRGGLTEKHVDVEELMRVLDFTPKPLEILTPRPAAACESIYPTETEEFRLSVVEVSGDCTYENRRIEGPEELLCMEGEARLKWDDGKEPLTLTRGGSILIPAALGGYTVTGRARLFKAAVGAATHR